MARKKLDFADSVGGAYTTLGANLGSFFILFAGWVALVVAATFGKAAAGVWISEISPAAAEAYASWPLLLQGAVSALPFLIATSVATISMVIAWHRRIIKGIVPSSPFPVAIGPIVGYLWRIIVVFAIPVVPVLLLILALSSVLASLFASAADPFEPMPAGRAIISIFTFVASIAAALVAGRFGLLLPAWAVGDRTMTFARAWLLTEGNTWLLFWGALVAVLPFSVVATVCEFLLNQQPIGGDSRTAVFALGAFSVLADMIGYVMAAGFYSFAYLQLTAPDESHIVQAPPALER